VRVSRRRPVRRSVDADALFPADRESGFMSKDILAEGGAIAPETAAKARDARDALGERDGVLVAFSGGVDSAVVAALARDALGGDAVACTARSETLPAAELDDATRVAGEIGIRHETVTFSELDDPDFVANDGDRCYHCRTMRLGRMYDAARELGIGTVCDGTNADDPGEGTVRGCARSRSSTCSRRCWTPGSRKTRSGRSPRRTGCQSPISRRWRVSPRGSPPGSK